MEKNKILKVWNHNKTEGRPLAATKLEELKLKVITKFEILNNVPFKLVLKDGCIIDDEEAYEHICNDSSIELFILKGNESLDLPIGTKLFSQSSGGSETQAGQNLKELVKRIRAKQSSLQKPKKIKKDQTVKVQLGWMLFSKEKFTQVRTQKGGGTRLVDMPTSSTYEDLLEKAKQSFFPNGNSVKGSVDDFEHGLGDFQGQNIAGQSFTLAMYIESMKECHMTIKPRLYLLSKPKDEEGDDEESNIDILIEPDVEEVQEEENTGSWDLPEIDVPLDVCNNSQNQDMIHAPPDLAEEPSPVVLRMPQVPTCTICTDRFSDTFFLPCGHIACTVCTAELEERGSLCHICREVFSSTAKLYY